MSEQYLPDWRDKVANHAQVGGIETSVLDNGVGKGTRIAWINTGTGLRYKVVIDRAMDIADAFYNQYSLAWLNHSGVSSSQPFSNKGADWLKTFGGGLLTTCGLSHIGGPEKDEFGERGVHGDASNIPAEIESIIQPDPAHGKLEMSITGIIKQTPIFGPALQLRRTISGKIGEAAIHIHDEVMNRGNTPAPHMLLYHINLGWPLADEGAKLIWKGKLQPKPNGVIDPIFNDKNDYKTCPPPLDAHAGSGENVGFIDIEHDEHGKCTCGLYNPNIKLGLSIEFNKAQLPWLTNWQHWGKGEYVTGLEPGTHPPIGQARARAEKTLIFIAPGEVLSYQVSIKIQGD